MTDLTNPLIAERLDRAKRVLEAHRMTVTDRASVAAAGGIVLEIKISDNQGVKNSAFAYDGIPVPAGRRRFIAYAGEPKLLKWIMFGNGPASMVVQVMNGDTVVAERTPSRIPGGYTSSFDLLQIAV